MVMTELRQLKPAQTGRPNLTENHQKCSNNDENRPKNHENSLKIAKNPAKTSNLPRHRKTPVSRSQILTSSTPMLPWQRISDHSRPDPSIRALIASSTTCLSKTRQQRLSVTPRITTSLSPCTCSEHSNYSFK